MAQTFFLLSLLLQGGAAVLIQRNFVKTIFSGLAGASLFCGVPVLQVDEFLGSAMSAETK